MRQSLLCLCFIAQISPSLLLAESSKEEKQEEKEKRKELREEYIETKVTKIADSYIPELKNPINIWAEVGLLYFGTKIKSMSYTSKKANILAISNFSTLSLQDVDFEWQPGFEVSVGYLQPRWQWDICLRGMHYHSGSKSRHAVDDKAFQGMFPVWSLSEDSLPYDYVTEASMTGRLSFDRVVLQSGYFTQLDPQFVIRTFLGVESVFIKQGYDIKYSGGIFPAGEDFIHMKNNFVGAGPQLGLQPWISLGKGLSFSGLASLSWILGSFNIKQNESYLDNELFHRDVSKVKGCWASDVKGTIAWKRPFYHNHFSFSVRLAWEYLVYFRQNRLKKDPYDRLQGGGVQMQGLILSTLFDF